MKDILLIIAPEGYQDIEYETPKGILENAGFSVVTASSRTGTCSGKLDGTAEATVALAEVNVEDYLAVAFIGGPGAINYQQDESAYRIAKEATEKSILLGAICIAPTILAHAGVLDGRNATVWNGDGEQSKLLEKHGATYLDEPVVADNGIITASGPLAAEAFGTQLVTELQLDQSTSS